MPKAKKEMSRLGKYLEKLPITWKGFAELSGLSLDRLNLLRYEDARARLNSEDIAQIAKGFDKLRKMLPERTDLEKFVAKPTIESEK
jgi:hypothetical protein